MQLPKAPTPSTTMPPAPAWPFGLLTIQGDSSNPFKGIVDAEKIAHPIIYYDYHFSLPILSASRSDSYRVITDKLISFYEVLNITDI
jgi:hypothetical protein